MASVDPAAIPAGIADPEAIPPGIAVPAVAPGAEIPAEPPAVGARALYVAGRLLAGATTFFFLAFLFAYFYLRSLNEDGLWHPAHVKPEQGLGAAMVICVLVSAGLAYLSGRRMRAGSGAWLVPALVSVVLGLATVVLQIVEYTSQGFGPTDGGYASVFVGWTSFFSVAVLGAMYWLETQVATEVRARRTPAPLDGDIRNADRLILPGLDAAAFFWAYLAGLGAVMYIVLYLL